jgi:hypothetical protein
MFGLMKAPTVTGNFNAGGSGGLFGQVSPMPQTMAMPSGGPNTQQSVPPGMGMGQPAPFGGPMVMPSGGPNMPTPLPTPVDGPMPEIGPAEPLDPIVRAICGLPPMSATPNTPAGGGGDNPSPRGQPMPPISDLFNRPLPSFGGGMAPAVPKPIDYGLGGQQMGFGNGMGSMNNWFSNFTAPRPPAAAPMMNMKGMFGVR